MKHQLKNILFQLPEIDQHFLKALSFKSIRPLKLCRSIFELDTRNFIYQENEPQQKE